MRRKSRDFAFKLIYQDQFDVNPEEFDQSANLTQEELQYAQQIVEKYHDNKQQILSIVKSSIKGYDVARVYKIDLSLLYLAIVENFYFSVPKAVAINEVLELSKLYSTEKSPSFINGILKEILK